MIIDDKQLKQTREQLAQLEEDLISLQREVYPVNPDRFHLMAEAYIDHIMELRKQIDEYVGIKIYQDKLEGVWLRLIGPSIQLGTASASILANTIENFRKSIRSIAAILKGEVPYRKGGVSKEVEKSCDLVIIGLMSGSMRVGLGLPPERQPDLFTKEEDPAIRAINTFMEVASWASALEVSPEIPSSIANLTSKDYVLRQVMNIAPSKKLPIDIIEFSGTLVHLPKLPVLTKESRSRLHDVIAKEKGAEYMEAIGTIREIDLDSLKFYLRERPQNEPQLHCEVSEEMIDDAKAALGEKVKVAGSAKRDVSGKITLLKVKTFEILTEE